MTNPIDKKQNKRATHGSRPDSKIILKKQSFCVLLVNRRTRTKLQASMLQKKSFLDECKTKQPSTPKQKRAKAKTPLETERTDNQIKSVELLHSADRLHETDAVVLASAKLATQIDDDINRLIKRLTLSFTAKGNESRFALGSGIFHGAQFHVVTESNNVAIKVSDASTFAQSLLSEHKDVLKMRLEMHDLSLRELQFF